MRSRVGFTGVNSGPGQSRSLWHTLPRVRNEDWDKDQAWGHDQNWLQRQDGGQSQKGALTTLHSGAVVGLGSGPISS